MNMQTGSVDTLAVLKTGELVSGSTDKTVRVWNASTGELYRTLFGHTAEVLCLCVLPTGELASGSNDSTIRIWNANLGQELRVLSKHTGAVTSIVGLKFNRMASGSLDRSVFIWDYSTGDFIKQIKESKEPVLNLAYLYGSELFVSSYNIQTAFKLSENETTFTAGLFKLAPSPNAPFTILEIEVLRDEKLATGSDDGAIRLFNTAKADFKLDINNGW